MLCPPPAPLLPHTALRDQCDNEELRLADVANELARLRVDALNVGAHNEQLGAALELLNAEISDKVGAHAAGVPGARGQGRRLAVGEVRACARDSRKQAGRRQDMRLGAVAAA